MYLLILLLSASLWAKNFTSEKRYVTNINFDRFVNGSSRSVKNSTNLNDSKGGKNNTNFLKSIWQKTFKLPLITPRNVDIKGNNKPFSIIYAMANGFVYLVLKPIDQVQGFVQNALIEPEKTWNYTNLYLNETEKDGDMPGKLYLLYKIMDFEKGYLICVVLGIIFIIATPIVGVCFCSCRLCNHCGGRMYQDLRMARSHWRPIYCCSSFGITMLLIFCNCCIFTTNLWVSEAVNKLPMQSDHVINSVENYMNGTVMQVEYLQDTANNLTNGLGEEMTKLGSLSVYPVISNLRDHAKFQYDNLQKLEPKILQLVKPVIGDLSVIQTKIKSLKKNSNLFQGEISSIRDELIDLVNKKIPQLECQKSVLCQEIKNNAEDHFRYEDDSLKIDSLEEFGDELILIRKLIENLPKIQAEMVIFLEQPENIRNSIDNDMIRYNVANNSITELEKIQNKLEASISLIPIGPEVFSEFSNELDSHRDLLRNTTENLEAYDDYRFGLAICMFLVLSAVIITNCVGFFGGICGYDKMATPIERSNCSNFGGLSLLISVSLSFIFSWVLMSLVTVSFTFGSHGERYFCKLFATDETITEIHELLDPENPDSDSSWEIHKVAPMYKGMDFIEEYWQKTKNLTELDNRHMKYFYASEKELDPENLIKQQRNSLIKSRTYGLPNYPSGAVTKFKRVKPTLVGSFIRNPYQKKGNQNGNFDSENENEYPVVMNFSTFLNICQNRSSLYEFLLSDNATTFLHESDDRSKSVIKIQEQIEQMKKDNADKNSNNKNGKSRNNFFNQNLNMFEENFKTDDLPKLLYSERPMEIMINHELSNLRKIVLSPIIAETISSNLKNFNAKSKLLNDFLAQLIEFLSETVPFEQYQKMLEIYESATNHNHNGPHNHLNISNLDRNQRFSRGIYEKQKNGVYAREKVVVKIRL